jgi:hypothetical protein
LLHPEERAVLKAALTLKAEPDAAVEAFDRYSDLLFNWASGLLEQYQPRSS